jgi:hypothetical protein
MNFFKSDFSGCNSALYTICFKKVKAKAKPNIYILQEATPFSVLECCRHCN